MPLLTVNNTTLYYETRGEGELLLFLHGLGSSGKDWELQVPYFSQSYRVITLDVRGHGQSTKAPGPYSVPLFADDVAAALRGLGVAGAHIVGVSMGGMIAFQLALDHPDLVESLVIVNSAPELVVRTWRERFMVWQRFLVLRLLGIRGIGRLLSKRLFPKPEHEEIRRVFVERWAQNDPVAYRAAMRALIGWSVSSRLAEITVPVLVLAADEDYSPVSAKEAYVARLPHAELIVVPDSRHALPVEHPETFNAIVAGFLAKQRPG